jgi:hypothetical protein
MTALDAYRRTEFLRGSDQQPIAATALIGSKGCVRYRS